MSSKIRVDALSEEQARNFWEESPQATGFNHPDALDILSQQTDWWGAWRGEDLVATWPLSRPYGNEIRPPIFAYYLGPMFNAEIHSFKYHRYWAIRQQAIEALLAFLINRYRRFSFSLPLGMTDIRAFDWWNHDHPGGSAFTITPRHTARIDQLQKHSEEVLFQGFARNRKRDIKRNDAEPPQPSEQWNDEEVIKLHDAPLRRQGATIFPQRHLALKRILSLVRRGFGQGLAFRFQDSGALASIIILLFGRYEANNVLCVSADEQRFQGLTAWTTWQGICRARAEGKDIFDFNGANSPSRAADKHCYNARAHLYFNINFE